MGIKICLHRNTPYNMCMSTKVFHRGILPMDNTTGALDLSYASDLQFIQAMYENATYWECIIDAELDFLNDGVDPHLSACVRPEIADSWITSSQKGLYPDQVFIVEQISNEQFEMAEAQNARLISVATPLLSSIESLNMKNDYIFELVDPDGLSYIQIGDLQLHQFAGERYLISEERVGTNAHSLCMQYKRPFIVIGPEHYCFALHGLIACAAPIIDQYDNAIGALLLTQPIPEGPLSSSDRKLLIHAMSLLSTLATTISAQLRLNSYDAQLADAQLKYSSAYRTAQQFEGISESLISSVKEGILVLDGGFTIMYASPEAAHVFNSSPREIAGVSLFELLAHDDQATVADFLLREEALDTTINGEAYMLSAKRLSTETADVETNGFILSFKKVPKTKRPALGASRKPTGDAAPTTFASILGRSCQIEKTKALAARFARTNENVLITGESGTGKELFAQAIHNASSPDGPFISINCAAIPPRLIESELFGYESGSFTGAEKGGKPGKIELADGGTLFLDEIGDMPLELQATLLRVLENKRVVRVGGTNYKQIDFRLVAATNQNLSDLVSQRLFREDLLYRLSVLSIQLPPLRNRIGDPLFFARYFLNECQIKTNNGAVNLSAEAERFIETYRWPGNVRQLKHAMYSAYYTCDRGIIEIDDFPAFIVNDLDIVDPMLARHSAEPLPQLNENPSSNTQTPGNPAGTLPTLSLEALEKIAIQQALGQCHGNIPEAAELLGISKATLYRKIKTLKR